MSIATASPTAKQIATEILASIPPFDDALALRTYAHLSHTPEDRARRERESFEAHILNVVELTLPYVGTPAQFEELSRAVTDYATGYQARLYEVLGARSRTASSFITGGANFPVKRNQKALAVEGKREAELERWLTNGLVRIRERIDAIATPEQKSGAIVKRMCAAIDQELLTIAAIERGEKPGFEAKHFAAVITRIVRGLWKQGFRAECNAVLNHTAKRMVELGITQSLTTKHAIWKHHTDLEGGGS
jgi:hypothetical protein